MIVDFGFLIVGKKMKARKRSNKSHINNHQSAIVNQKRRCSNGKNGRLMIVDV
jgi:hypothetical protein